MAALQPAPDRVQVTPLFAESFATVAVKLVVAPTITLAVVCESVTVMGTAVAVTRIAAEAVFVGSVTEVAVSVIAGGVGTLAGAV